MSRSVTTTDIYFDVVDYETETWFPPPDAEFELFSISTLKITVLSSLPAADSSILTAWSESPLDSGT